MNDKKLLEVFYFQVTDLWQKMCEMHSTLFDLTCDEYSYLLSSDIDNLEESIKKKQILLQEINLMENFRLDLINVINDALGDNSIKKVSDLLLLMQENEIEKEQKHLERFNSLLIDIIEKIQTQNKKNQMFINRALLTLKDIREEATGKKSYPTYTAFGATTKSTSDFFLRK